MDIYEQYCIYMYSVQYTAYPRLGVGSNWSWWWYVQLACVSVGVMG